MKSGDEVRPGVRTSAVVAFLLLIVLSTQAHGQSDYLRIVDSYRSGAVTNAMRAMLSLDRVQVDGAVHFVGVRLAAEDDDALRQQARAAALLHTEIVISGAAQLPSQRSWHLSAAKRLVDFQQATGQSAVKAESISFARRWALLVAWYRHGMLDMEGLGQDVAELGRRFPNDPDVLLLSGSFAETLGWRALAATIIVPLSLSHAVRDRARRLDEARSAYERALRLAPALDEARLRLARIYEETHQYELALPALETVVRESTTVWVGYLAQLLSGRALEGVNRPAEAVAHYRQAAELCVECQVPLIALSNALRKTDDREGADRAARAAAARPSDGDDPWRQYYCGQSYRMSAALRELRREVAR